MIGYINEKTKFYNGGNNYSLNFFSEIEDLLEKGHFYALESGKSEDIAAFVHFFLTITPY